MPKNKITKENPLGLVVATKKEALFMKVRDNLNERIKAYEEELVVARVQLKQTLEIIEKEKNAH